MDFDAFKGEWLGRRIDYDHVYQYQCVDLILEYLKEYADMPSGVNGNAIDYWTKTSPALAARCQRIASVEAQKGDIVVLNGLPGNPYGHIGIATGSADAVNVEILEQNGATGGGSGLAGDAIRLRSVPKSRIAGLLRLQSVAAAVAPSQPSVPLPPAGALVAPSGELYAVVKRIPGYLTSGQAKTRQNSNSTVDIGSYNVYNRYNDMINVTKKPGYAGWWINPADNVPEPFVSAFTPPPVPPAGTMAATAAGGIATVSSVTTATVPADDPQSDWHTTYHPFVDKYGRRTPRKYVSIANYIVKDLDTRKADVPLPAGWIVWVGGTFTVGKTVYARPQDATDRFLWYGIPLDEGIIDLYDKVYSTKTTVAERQTMHAMKPLDYLAMAIGQLEKFWNMLTFQNKKVI